MQEPTIKPRTRCECLDVEKCHYCDVVNYDYPDTQCTAEAVRMVTVREYKRVIVKSYGDHEEQQDRRMVDVETHVPMCAACAEWHERGAK